METAPLTFSPEDMQEMTEDPVLIEFIEDGRWTKLERVICYHNRKFYSVMRVTGLTEYQENDDLDERFPEQPKLVRPVSITAMVWQEVKNQ